MENLNTAEFMAHVNRARLAAKGQWYFLEGAVNGKRFAVKGFGTWLQRLTIGGVKFFGPSGSPVSTFKDTLKEAADYIDPLLKAAQDSGRLHIISVSDCVKD